MQPCDYSFNYSIQLYMPGNWTVSVVPSFLLLSMTTPSHQLKNISHISTWKIQSSTIYKVPNHDCSSLKYTGEQKKGIIVRITALKRIIYRPSQHKGWEKNSLDWIMLRRQWRRARATLTKDKAWTPFSTLQYSLPKFMGELAILI